MTDEDTNATASTGQAGPAHTAGTEVAIDGDEEELRSGLVALVLALVEIVDDALEREAIRRMESGQLDPEEIERLGRQLERLSEEIDRLERREGVDGEVERLRGELNDAVEDALVRMGDTGTGRADDAGSDAIGGDRS